MAQPSRPSVTLCVIRTIGLALARGPEADELPEPRDRAKVPAATATRSASA